MLSNNRLTRISVTVLIGLFFSFVVVWFTDTEATSQLKRGDFPGFYGPAVAIHRGMNDLLYDFDVQRDLQNEFWPSFEGSFYISAYPPFVAAILRPLALFSPITAKLISTVALFFLMCFSLLVAKPLVPMLKQHWLFGATLCLLFPPMFSGVLAAQNTALSLFLYVVAIRFLIDNCKLSDFWAGVSLGLWLFKPQYPLILIFCLAISKRWYVLLGAAIPALLFYVIGASVYGFDWPFTWLFIANSFSSWNTVGNRSQIVSIRGFLGAIGEVCALNQDLWLLAGSILSVVFFVIFVYFFWKSQNSKNREQTTDLLFLSAPIILIVSPQTLFYDIGIAVVSFARSFGEITKHNVIQLLLFFVLIVLIALARTEVEFPLYSMLAFYIVGYLLFDLRVKSFRSKELP